MKPERDVFQRRFLTLVAVSLVWLGPGVSTGQEVAQGEVAQGEAKQNATGKLVQAETPALDDAKRIGQVAQQQATQQQATQQQVTQQQVTQQQVTQQQGYETREHEPDSVSGSIATGTPNDATQRALKGMIDGDVNAAVPVSIIPQVLTDAEREKLGMTQSRFQLPALAAASTALPDGQGDGDRYPETFVQQFGHSLRHCLKLARNAPPIGTGRYLSGPQPTLSRIRGISRTGCSSGTDSSSLAVFSHLPRERGFLAPSRCFHTCGPCRIPVIASTRWAISTRGECVPIMMQRPPYENRAVIVETGAAAAVIIGLP